MTKVKYYLNLAKEVSKASKCLRSHFGAIIVRDDMIIGTGYNGPARGVPHCSPCKRENCPSGQGYNLCNAVHAEVNAVIQAEGRKGCLGATLYINSHNKPWDGTQYNQGMGDFCCDNCARVIINSGIEYVVQEQVINGKAKSVVHHIPTLVKEGKLW